MTARKLVERSERMARTAYRDALGDRYSTAAHMLEQIAEECGVVGIHVALIYWCDLLIDHMTDGSGGPIRTGEVVFIHSDTGELDDGSSPRVPAQYQWAGEMICARAVRDRKRWNELVGDIPIDETGIGRYVFALLTLVATTVNGLPRGYDRMGDTSDLEN